MAKLGMPRSLDFASAVRVRMRTRGVGVLLPIHMIRSCICRGGTGGQVRGSQELQRTHFAEVAMPLLAVEVAHSLQ